ncbi:MAG: hypothetical protein H7841_01510 [Magnetospirillum sp. WYHS-4]
MGGTEGGVERRLVLRLLGHWRAAAEGRPLPTFAALSARDLEDIRPALFLLRLRRDREPVVEGAGRTLTLDLDGSPIGLAVSAVPAASLLGQATAYYEQVLEKGVPISHGGNFVDASGCTVKFRGIILPLDDGRGAIGYLIGAANCKIQPPDA